MKIFVALLVMAVCALGLAGFSVKSEKPTGGYLPITEVVPPIVRNVTTGVDVIELPFTFAMGWEMDLEYAFYTTTLEWQPVGLPFKKVATYALQTKMHESNAKYIATENLSPGQYVFRAYVGQFFENAPQGTQTLQWNVTCL